MTRADHLKYHVQTACHNSVTAHHIAAVSIELVLQAWHVRGGCHKSMPCCIIDDLQELHHLFASCCVQQLPLLPAEPKKRCTFDFQQLA